jgi:hypothetical protein
MTRKINWSVGERAAAIGTVGNTISIFGKIAGFYPVGAIGIRAEWHFSITGPDQMKRIAHLI